MNQRVLSGVLVLGSTLATVGAAVSAGGSSDSNGDEAARVISSSVVDQDQGSVSGQAQTKVPVRNGLLADDIISDNQGPVPVAVRIGDIGVEAPILSVGVDESNQLAVPAADTVGWYEYSASPGEAGSTVLAAHVDYGGVPGAFFNLADLEVGDTIEVEMSDGSTLDYRVTANTQYQKTDLPAEDVFRKTGSTVLKLITCGGEFDPAARSYLANVVITAVPAGPQSF